LELRVGVVRAVVGVFSSGVGAACATVGGLGGLGSALPA
jgi:hypothetical protein